MMPDSSSEQFVRGSCDVDQTCGKEHHPNKSKETFIWLWIGQLVSNLGTQTSLYGIGLWLFSKTQLLYDFALVALVVQLARIIVLPLLANRLTTWSRRRVMLIANGIGAVCTFALAMLLLRDDFLAPLSLLLFVQSVAAMSEAALILSFSTLIPVLIVDRKELIRANGLFATTDSLVLTMAPFFGAWFSGLFGLRGVLTLDGCSFFIALICVLAAPWSRKFVAPSKALHQWQGFDLIQGWNMMQTLLTKSPFSRIALVISTSVAFSYAATEILFPAWVAVAYGTSQMALVIIVAALGYIFGFWLWREKIGVNWQRIWFIVILIQAMILMGAGLQVFAERPLIWFGGVFVFSSGLPIVMSSIQQAWTQLASGKDLPRIFALRYTFEWSARLLAFLVVSLSVDLVLKPALTWPHLPTWLQASLGVGNGRYIAVALGGVGWILVFAIWSQIQNLRSIRQI